MSIQRIQPGPRMSNVVVHGGVAYLAGQVGSGGTVREQTESALNAIDQALASAGTDKSKLLSATVYLPDMAGFSEMNSAWEAWIDPANPPTRATVEAKLAADEYLVEIVVTAAA